jgi:hypothetical protein
MAYIDGNHTFAVCLHDAMKARGHGASCIVLNDTVTCEGARGVGESMRMFNLGDVTGSWDFLEVAFDAGLLVALKREPRPAPTQGDFDQWDAAGFS